MHIALAHFWSTAHSYIILLFLVGKSLFNYYILYLIYIYIITSRRSPSTPQLWVEREGLIYLSIVWHSTLWVRQLPSWVRQLPSRESQSSAVDPSQSRRGHLKRDPRGRHYGWFASFQASDLTVGDSWCLGVEPLPCFTCAGRVSHRCPMTLSHSRKSHHSLCPPCHLVLFILDYIFFSY